MKIQVIKFLDKAIKVLDKSQDFGTDFCRLKVDFFNKFQDGLVFSTTFGAEIFHRLRQLILDKKLIQANGEYDKHINQFLNKLYIEK